MIRLAHDLLKPLAISAVAALIATCHGGCAPYRPAATDQAEAAVKYQQALMKCVQQSATLVESHTCRRAANKAFGVCEGVWPRYVPCPEVK